MAGATHRGLAAHLAGVHAGVDPQIAVRLGPVGAVLFTHPDLIDLDADAAWWHPGPPEPDRCDLPAADRTDLRGEPL